MAEFAEMRKQIRKPLTENAARLALKKLQEFPREDWIPVLEQSTMNAWQGLFPVHDGPDGGGQGSGRAIGGVSKRVRETNAQCQKHNVVSPGMAEAARKMMEDEG